MVCATDHVAVANVQMTAEYLPIWCMGLRCLVTFLSKCTI